MNNSNNRNWAIEYATKLTEHAAGLTIMTVTETAWNNLTPSQQQDILDIYGREDYAAVAIPLRRPPLHTTPHKRGLVGQRLRRRKPSTPTVPLQKSEPTSRA